MGPLTTVRRMREAACRRGRVWRGGSRVRGAPEPGAASPEGSRSAPSGSGSTRGPATDRSGIRRASSRGHRLGGRSGPPSQRPAAPAWHVICCAGSCPKPPMAGKRRHSSPGAGGWAGHPSQLAAAPEVEREQAARLIEPFRRRRPWFRLKLDPRCGAGPRRKRQVPIHPDYAPRTPRDPGRLACAGLPVLLSGNFGADVHGVS